MQAGYADSDDGEDNVTDLSQQGPDVRQFNILKSMLVTHRAVARGKKEITFPKPREAYYRRDGAAMS